MDDIRVIFFFFQAEDGIRDKLVTGVQTCALPILHLARVAGLGDALFERAIPHRVSGVQHVPGVAVRVSVVANATVPVEAGGRGERWRLTGEEKPGAGEALRANGFEAPGRADGTMA